MAKVALLIGVSEYEPGLPCLEAAVRDIEALRRVLQDPEMGGFDEVKKLANPEAHTMQLEIETLFDGRAKDDLVLLFFSGHGVLDADGTLYFASRNTRKNVNGDLIQSTAVETRFVHKIMNNSPAKRQAIILDCCYSGAFDPALQPKDDGSVDLLKQLGSEGRVVLTSSNSTERSFEQQGADLSIYTRYLVEGIETGAGDQNGDGFVSMLELHEYAASKVRETAPKMTPTIIVMKDKGFEIVLAKAKVTDPKLKYRKTASRYANAGTIRPAGRAILDKLRQQLGLTLEEVTEIEAEVLRPYQDRLANLQQYRETLLAEAEHEYPLSEFAREDLITLQQMLGLRDEDILPIQKEVEAQFSHQTEEQERPRKYQETLQRYEQEFTKAIAAQYPIDSFVRDGLNKFQQSLELSDEDVARIEAPLVAPKKLAYQQRLAERLIQEEEERQRDDLSSELLGANYYAKLRDLLKGQEWQAADRETADRMCEVMGAPAEEILSTDRRCYLTIENVKNFPCQDLQTIDRLWVKYSNGHFGFSVQKKIWQECSSPISPDKDWDRFRVKVGWNGTGTEYVDYFKLKFDPKKSPMGELPIFCVGESMVYGDFATFSHHPLKMHEEWWYRIAFWDSMVEKVNFFFLAQRLVECCIK